MGNNSRWFGMLRSRGCATPVSSTNPSSRWIAGVASRSKHDTHLQSTVNRVHKTRADPTPISSTNLPRSLPVPNGPSAGSKLANMGFYHLGSVIIVTHDQ